MMIMQGQTQEELKGVIPEVTIEEIGLNLGLNLELITGLTHEIVTTHPEEDRDLDPINSVETRATIEDLLQRMRDEVAMAGIKHGFYYR